MLHTVALVVKNLPANAGDTGDGGLIPGWGSSPGGGNGNPLQYSCLENPMNRGAVVHGVTKSWAISKKEEYGIFKHSSKSGVFS